jgi:alcohol dehydrogenase
MRAVAFFEHGGPEVLHLVHDWPEPEPAEHDVVVKVEACALNHLDLFVRRGMPGAPIELPRVSGGDMAGTVIALGQAVTDVPPGLRVLVDPAIALPGGRTGALGEDADGGLTERIAVPAANVIPLPPGVSATDAAALPIAYGTAHRMLITRGQVQPGETVVVLGASGGVGTACVQLAAMLGAEVIAVASSQAKLDRLAELGARHLVLARGAEYGGQVWKLTGKRGADVIVDYSGEETWPATVRTVRHGGRILVCGATSGYQAVTDLRYVWVRESTIIGSNGWCRADLEALLRLVAAGRLRPVVDRVVGLDQVRQAEEDLEARSVFGKIVIDPHA